MQWGEFQDTADRLARGGAEGDWRSAVSRAYYAVYHFFREFLLSHGLDAGRGAQSHFNLYSGLLHSGFPQVAAIASRIDSLRAHRVWADYDLSRQLSARVAHTAVRTSRLLIADFQSVLASVPAAQVVAGARQLLASIGRLGRQP
jgi:uncharacterized protein (UPF0332 family)